MLTALVQASLRPLSKNYNLPFKQNTVQEIRDKNMPGLQRLIDLWPSLYPHSTAYIKISRLSELWIFKKNYKVNQKDCFFYCIKKEEGSQEIVSRLISFVVNELLINANVVSIKQSTQTPGGLRREQRSYLVN